MKPKDIEFLDKTRLAYQLHPVKTARETPTFFQKTQIDEAKKFNFATCPGMMDLKNYGYIVPAWDDIHVLANKSGVMAILGGIGSKRPTSFDKPRKMDASIGSGIVEMQDDIPLEVIHIGSPWGVLTNNKNVSVFALPAFFHSRFLDDLYVYPGVINYGNFSSLNFIFSAKRKCDITIKAGEPLLQVIPFQDKAITAGYGPADDYQKDKMNSIYSSAKQFYRRYISRPTPTSLE